MIQIMEFEPENELFGPLGACRNAWLLCRRKQMRMPSFYFIFNGKRAIWISNSVYPYIDAYVSVSNFTHSSRNQKEDHSEPRAVPYIYIDLNGTPIYRIGVRPFRFSFHTTPPCKPTHALTSALFHTRNHHILQFGNLSLAGSVLLFKAKLRWRQANGNNVKCKWPRLSFHVIWAFCKSNDNNSFSFSLRQAPFYAICFKPPITDIRCGPIGSA